MPPGAHGACMKCGSFDHMDIDDREVEANLEGLKGNEKVSEEYHIRCQDNDQVGRPDRIVANQFSHYDKEDGSYHTIICNGCGKSGNFERGDTYRETDGSVRESFYCQTLGCSHPVATIINGPGEDIQEGNSSKQGDKISKDEFHINDWVIVGRDEWAWTGRIHGVGIPDENRPFWSVQVEATGEFTEVPEDIIRHEASKQADYTPKIGDRISFTHPGSRVNPPSLLQGEVIKVESLWPNDIIVWIRSEDGFSHPIQGRDFYNWDLQKVSKIAFDAGDKVVNSIDGTPGTVVEHPALPHGSPFIDSDVRVMRDNEDTVHGGVFDEDALILASGPSDRDWIDGDEIQILSTGETGTLSSHQGVSNTFLRIHLPNGKNHEFQQVEKSKLKNISIDRRMGIVT